MPAMPGAGGGSNFFLAKGSKAEAAKKRKVAAAASSKSRKGSLVKTKPKTGGKKGKFDTGAGLTKKKRSAEDDDEEILSDASDVVGDETAGKGKEAYSRYDKVAISRKTVMHIAHRILNTSSN